MANFQSAGWAVDAEKEWTARQNIHICMGMCFILGMAPAQEFEAKEVANRQAPGKKSCLKSHRRFFVFWASCLTR
jgi:hypothetical protein